MTPVVRREILGAPRSAREGAVGAIGAVNVVFANVITLAIVLVLAPTALHAQGARLRVVEVQVEGRVEP